MFAVVINAKNGVLDREALFCTQFGLCNFRKPGTLRFDRDLWGNDGLSRSVAIDVKKMQIKNVEIIWVSVCEKDSDSTYLLDKTQHKLILISHLYYSTLSHHYRTLRMSRLLT